MEISKSSPAQKGIPVAYVVRAKAIQCEDCDVWYHSSCMNIGPKTYSDLGKSSVVWICHTCGIPNVATCTFVDLESFSASNPFDELSVFNSDFSENAHTELHQLET